MQYLRAIPFVGFFVCITALSETHLKIEEESDFINQHKWLFIHNWRGKLRHHTVRQFNKVLREYGININLTNEIGDKITISSHQFRHTVATNLINNGVSLLHVQKFLGHRSSEMTMVYAEIHDLTLKKAIEQATTKLIDIKGNFYDTKDLFQDIGLDMPTDACLEAKWLKKNIATQSLPNGICALPIRQKCPHANACLTCPSFRTDNSFLETHKSHLSRTNKLIQQAESNQFTRQAEINKNVANNLSKIIEVMENNG